MLTGDYLFFTLKLIAALGCGLVAGVFFAFSTFVMKALGQLPPAQGIAAMQSINVAVLNTLFGVVFFGTAAACIALTIAVLTGWHPAGSAYLLAGCLLYVVGTFVSTIVFNVPLNDALAAVEQGSTPGVDLWVRYQKRWTAWNHVRTVAALAATALFSITLCFRAAP